MAYFDHLIMVYCDVYGEYKDGDTDDMPRWKLC